MNMLQKDTNGSSEALTSIQVTLRVKWRRKRIDVYNHKLHVAEWLRRSVSNHVRSTRVGSNPVVGNTTSQQSTQLSIHPKSINEYSEVTLRAKALDTY